MMVSDSLKLDIPTLKGLHYHWFWGLGYSKTPHPMNIGSVVEELLKNKGKLTYMIETQLALSQHHTVARFFYWLFNINNYSYHAYVLAASKEHQQYLQNSVEKNSSMETHHNVVWGLLGTALGYASLKIYRILKQAASKAKAAPPEVDASKEVVAKEASNVQSVLVTSLMQPHLVILGIQRNIGDLLSLPDFKAACRTRYLSSHPDKPGGTKEEFCRVKEAAERVTQMMSSPGNSSEMHSFSDNPDKFWKDYCAGFNRLMVEIAKFKADEEAARVNLQTEIMANIAKFEAKNEADIANLKTEIMANIAKFEAENEADKIKFKAENEADRIKFKAENEADRLKFKAEDEADRVKFKAEDEAARIKFKDEMIALINEHTQQPARVESSFTPNSFFPPKADEIPGAKKLTRAPGLN